MKKLFIYFFFIFPVLFSCSDLNEVIPVEIPTTGVITPPKPDNSLATKINSESPDGYQAIGDLTYGPSQFHNFDLYKPVFDKSAKHAKSVALIIVHGGGWSLLDKSFINGAVEEFKKKEINITIFNINHQLAGYPGIYFNQIMGDFDLFFNHLNSLKTELNLADEVIMWGYSSGGHLALSYSYLHPARNIKAVVGFVAPTDLTMPGIYNNIFDSKNQNLTEQLIGVSFIDNPQLYQDASPYFMANSSSPPTLLIYGENDKTVPASQGEKLDARLKENKVTAEYHLIPNASHEMIGKMPEVINLTLAFLNKL